MRGRSLDTLVLLVTVAAVARGDILWHNYADGYSADPARALSSERDTLIDQTWTVDDAVFASPVRVEAVQWVGMRADVDQYQYPFADLIILDSDLRELAVVADVEYSVIWQSGGPALETYEALLELDTPIVVPAGQWYFGTRLVGRAELGLGRAFVAAADRVNPAGQSQGYFWGPIFGVPEWLPVEELPLVGEPRDYAYAIHGVVVPEPSALALLVGGAALALARR